MTIAELIYEQSKQLPEPLAQEVLDFVGYLRLKQERREWRDLIEAQSVALSHVWDNEADQVWDNV